MNSQKVILDTWLKHKTKVVSQNGQLKYYIQKTSKIQKEIIEFNLRKYAKLMERISASALFNIFNNIKFPLVDDKQVYTESFVPFLRTADILEEPLQLFVSW